MDLMALPVLVEVHNIQNLVQVAEHLLEDLLALSQSVVVMHIFSVGDPTQNLHTENPLQNMDSIHWRLIQFVAVAIL
jgi:hypothetical protein